MYWSRAYHEMSSRYIDDHGGYSIFPLVAEAVCSKRMCDNNNIFIYSNDITECSYLNPVMYRCLIYIN